MTFVYTVPIRSGGNRIARPEGGISVVRRVTARPTGPFLRYWLPALILVPLLLAALALLWPGREIADDLGARAGNALRTAGLPGVVVQVTGRDMTLLGVPAGMEEEALTAVADVPGIREVRLDPRPRPPAAGPPGARTGAVPTVVPAGRGDGFVGALPKADRGQPAARLGEVLRQVSITFATDRAGLTGRPVTTAQRVTEVLRGAPAARVELNGYAADTSGPPGTAQRLSERRAAVVADVLTAGGVDQARITPRRLGNSEPLSTSAASRRVEISIR
jgi:outer membrane protein OmpA-like peptidoglycan-associated protein